MTRRCSHCNQNGHNSRTCPNRGVKLFGVRLTEGSIRKCASMGNLSHHSSGSGLSGLVSNNPASPGDGPDHGVGGDGYASEDFVHGSSSSSSRERKRGNPWREEEHRMFLLGLQKLGKGDWRGISRSYVKTRTPTQVASHAQKYFIRLSNVSRRKRRSSLFDIVPPDEVMDSHELQAEDVPMQGSDLILETEERESMKSTNSSSSGDEPPTVTVSASFGQEDAIQTELQPPPPGSFPVLYPAYFSPFYSFPFPVWPAAYVTGPPAKEEAHEILRPTAVHSKAAPINVDQLLGMSKLSLGEFSQNGVLEQSLSLKLVGGSASRQSAFHPNPANGGGVPDMNTVIHAV
ncbi:transcription factor KUA1-like isoform X2 [Raphanus sativus]|uniref:Transcription factor KUA1-like isoform X2 n=1 Tax=Raphanus sativus TaxID=3726 RepID=A0A6J0NCV0_RAPSA|nr:transcription factor KUA1-like isoform X2 [Raphanus sativus]